MQEPDFIAGNAGEQPPSLPRVHWTAIASLCFSAFILVNFIGILVPYIAVMSGFPLGIYYSLTPMVMGIVISPTIAVILAHRAIEHGLEPQWSKGKRLARIAMWISYVFLVLEVLLTCGLLALIQNGLNGLMHGM